MTQRRLVSVAWVGLSAMTVMCLGCKAKLHGPTGFLSDYSRLQKVDEEAMRYISPELRGYSKYMIDPVQVKEGKALKREQRAEVAKYMREAVQKELQSRNYILVSNPGPDVARLRIAITDVQDAKWWLNVHPASKVSGAGRAQASMEAEVVDSVTGEQLAAAIRAGKGKQFELNPFSTIDDVKSTIDQWAKSAGERLDELKKGAGA